VNLAQPPWTIDVEWMHAETSGPAAPCVVCGASDARALTTTTLADGTRVPVCGSHELAHRRVGTPARTTEELVRLAAERRRRHRRAARGDELAGMLTDAFGRTRRRDGERRRAG